jgi:hypothetical protein
MLTQLQIRFIINLHDYDYNIEQIQMLSTDIHTIEWIKHCLKTFNIAEKNIDELFHDDGFHEFLEAQFANPITFEEML